MKFNIMGKQLIIDFKNAYVQSLPALSDDTSWKSYLSGRGFSVSSDTALKISVVIRCADVVAKTMASLGCHLYQNGIDGNIRAKDYPLYKLLRYLPNNETTAYEFWHMYIFNLMLTNGAYAKIIRDSNGFITALWNIPTKNVEMHRNTTTGERYIKVFLENNTYEYLYEPFFMHTPGLRFNDPNNPEDFIRLAADVLGLTINLNAYAKDYFQNGSNMGGFIEYPGKVGEESFRKFKEEWRTMYEGVMNQHKWPILEGGFKVTKMDSNPTDSQALESRKFQVIEVCRIMGVPPSKAFDMDKSSYASVEQENINYVQETLDPLDERLAETIYKDLLNAFEQNIYYAQFNVNKLLKGDITARTTYYNTMRNIGVYSANDIRQKEDEKNIPDAEGGNAYLVNGNMIGLKWAKDNKPKSLQTGSGQ